MNRAMWVFKRSVQTTLTILDGRRTYYSLCSLYRSTTTCHILKKFKLVRAYLVGSGPNRITARRVDPVVWSPQEMSLGTSYRFWNIKTKNKSGNSCCLACRGCPCWECWLSCPEYVLLWCIQVSWFSRDDALSLPTSSLQYPESVRCQVEI